MISWLENHLLPCAYKELFGINCPACGSQRALVLLLKGNIRDSFFMYPPLIPVLLGAAIWISCFFKPSLLQVAKKYTWFLLGIVMVNYILHFFF